MTSNIASQIMQDYRGEELRKKVMAALKTNAAILDRIDCNDRETVLRFGVMSGVALNGEFMPWLRPHPVPSESVVREAIEIRI